MPDVGVTPKYGGPEYETPAASGSLCGVGDLKALARVSRLLRDRNLVDKLRATESADALYALLLDPVQTQSAA